MKKITYYLVLWFLFSLGIMFLALALNSCAITKAKQSKQIDSTHVNRTDSGSVKSNSNSEKNRADWERQIIIYNRDTTINNYIATGGKAPVINLPQPRMIITERGSSAQEKQNNNYDSGWRSQIDSLRLFIAESSKQKKESALSLLQIIGLCAGITIAILLLSKIKISLK